MTGATSGIPVGFAEQPCASSDPSAIATTALERTVCPHEPWLGSRAKRGRQQTKKDLTRLDAMMIELLRKP
jgi:hypothetical protein